MISLTLPRHQHLEPYPVRSESPGGGAKAIHPLEVTLTFLVGLNLCLLPWAFGGVDVGAQRASAGLAVAALVASLVPRQRRREGNTESAPVQSRWRRLRDFPVFWTGLVLFAYLGVQAFNPAFEYHLNGAAWWLTRRDHLGWLPAGMKVPFADMNAWRALMIWGSGWATICALWVGVTHRRTILWLLAALSVNAAAFAAFGLIQRAGGAPGPYGLRAAESPFFFAAFVYKNHAAAYLSLLGSVTLGMAAHAFSRSRRRQERSSPAILYLFFTLILALGIVLSFSLSGIVLFAVILLLVAAVAVWRLINSADGIGGKAPVVVTAAVLLIAVTGLGAAVGYGDLQKGVQRAIGGKAMASARTRWLAAGRGWEMFEDRWTDGWGAGCFRYGFTKYQHREPELTQWRQLRLRWEHLHDDWLELLTELGVAGVLPIVFGLAFWLRQVVRLRLWRHAVTFPIICGLAMLGLHALWDFPLQNPAVLDTACALLPLVVRWGELENRATRGETLFCAHEAV